ncbi:MAG: response regulator [Chloroherpetonaceae bacterium]|nr:response regulator [Chloroherpetonaceae bacterium]
MKRPLLKKPSAKKNSEKNLERESMIGIEPNEPNGYRVLIVDDDQLIRKTLSQNLALSGYMPSTAGTAKDAIKEFDRNKPHISLVDINLPDLDGFSLLKTLRKKNPEAEIIFITGEGDMNVVIEALRVGASDFVPKPLSIHTLLNVLEAAARRVETNLNKNGEDKKRDSKKKGYLNESLPIHVQAFGPLRIMINGREIIERDWQNAMNGGVMKILLMNHKKVVTTESLIESLRKGASFRSAEVMVFTAISFIRRLLEPELKSGRKSKYIISHENGYELNFGEFGTDYFYDIEHFEKLIKQARNEKNNALFQQAVEIYSDDFLANNVADEWSSFNREKLRDTALTALSNLGEYSKKASQFDEAALYARKMISLDALFEPAYLLLIDSLILQNRHTEAKRVVKQAEAAFQKLLDAPLPPIIASRVKG